MVYSSFRQQSGDHVAAAGRLFVQALLPQVISLMLWLIFNVKGLPTWSTRQPHWRAIAPQTFRYCPKKIATLHVLLRRLDIFPSTENADFVLV